MLGVAGYVYANYRFDQIRKVHPKHLAKPPPPGQPFNILIVGSDSRSFVTNSVQEHAFGNPTLEGGQRSDVTMVAKVVPATRQVYILSIPRDLWLHIPGSVPGISGMNRINAAFNNGPDLLIQTIEQDLHIPINHYLSVNFNGFQNMVDALGGITMDFPTPVRDQYSGLDVTQTGCQQVGGATSLELVRARHLYYEQSGSWVYDGNSDLSRIQRQDAFFRAVLQKLNASLTNPFAVNGFIQAAVQNLTIDDSLSLSELIHLSLELRGLPQSNLHTATLPTVGYTTGGGADVLLQAQPYANAAVFVFDAEGAASTPSSTVAPAPAHPTTTTQAALPASQVQVQVLNGSDWSQPIASETAAGLRRAGFVVTGVGNASTESVTTSVVEYAEGARAAGDAVAAAIGGPVEVAADPKLTGDQVVLMVGKSFTGVTATAAEASTTTTTTTVGAPASDIYTNNKPEPWNPVPCTL